MRKEDSKQLNVNLTQEEGRRIKKLAHKFEVTQSELVRIWIKMFYLKTFGDEEKE